MLTSEEIARRWDAMDANLKAEFEKTGMKMAEISSRMTELEQRAAASRRGDYEKPSLGRLVAGSDEFKGLQKAKAGRANIQIKTTITSDSASGGAFAPAEHITTPNLLPKRRVRIRDLVAPGRTGSSSVEYPRQTTRTNAAATVAETVAKPESTLAFEPVNVPVRTIAHWVPASKQIFDDAAVLESIIDAELRYGLADVEELQLLMGDGLGTNLNGIYTQAAAFTDPLTLINGPLYTKIDVLLSAIAQVEVAGFEADGIVVNSLDWRRILALQTADGDYLGQGPFTAEQLARLWTLPVVNTPVMTEDKFLVGAFRANAQIFDREEANVEISTEHADYFTKNMVAIRAEQRLAFAVYRGTAFVKGDFGDAGAL